MSTSLIQSLLQSPSQAESTLKAKAILNAQFSTIDDLYKLDTLLVDTERDHKDLQFRSLNSQAGVDKLIDDTRVAAERLLDNARELALQRHTLADELSLLSRALISDSSEEDSQTRLLDDLETMHRNLKELESVKDYVLVLEKALALSEAAVEQVRTDAPVTSELLKGYKQLQEYTASVIQSLSVAQGETTGQPLHLVSFLEKIRDKTWLDIRTYFFSKLIEAAEKLGWPAPLEYLATPQTDRRAFEIAFMSLLKLQMLCKKLHGTRPPVDKDGLYPIQALVQPISLRFKYHFEGSRQTNKLDKPEWYLTHVQNVSHEHKLFFSTVIQGLLDRTDFRETSAWKEFTFLLLPLLTRKLKKTIPQLLQHPSLLAHTIYEALSFDTAMVEEGFSLEGTSAPNPLAPWEGISDFILGNPHWFETWVIGEQNFIEDRYNELISSPDAWLVADQGEGTEDLRDLRPTNSARKVKGLVEQVTERCSSLPNPVQRAHFLVKIQLPLLDSYHGRISSSLDAFETLTSVFMRAVPGALGVTLRGDVNMQVDPRNLTSGSAGVNRLSKALLSATYIKAALDGWSDDVFFLQLWSEFSKNAALASWAEAVELLPEINNGKEETVFSVVTSKYQDLATRAENMIVQLICNEAENGLRAHFSSVPVASAGSSDLALSQTLLVPMSALSTHLTFLRDVIPKPGFTSQYRRIAKRLADFIFQHQIMHRDHFSSSDARVLHSEAELWVETCFSAVEGALGGGRPRVQGPWNKTLQAARLIGLEGEARERALDATFGATDDDEWERVIFELVDICELERDEVERLLRRRSE